MSIIFFKIGQIIKQLHELFKNIFSIVKIFLNIKTFFAILLFQNYNQKIVPDINISSILCENVHFVNEIWMLVSNCNIILTCICSVKRDRDSDTNFRFGGKQIFLIKYSSGVTFRCFIVRAPAGRGGFDLLNWYFFEKTSLSTLYLIVIYKSWT